MIIYRGGEGRGGEGRGGEARGGEGRGGEGRGMNTSRGATNPPPLNKSLKLK